MDRKSNFYNVFVLGPAIERGNEVVFITWEEDMRRNDGQPRLRASIATKLRKVGTPAEQAEREATLRLLELRQLAPGRYDVHAGDDVIQVTIKGDD